MALTRRRSASSADHEAAVLESVRLPLLFLALVALLTFSACSGKSPSGDPGRAAAEVTGNCDFDAAPSDASFDLVITGGRVMDPECDFDGVRNVGIAVGRIVTITTAEISGADSVDATGYVVTAGFIDTHTHSSDKFVHQDER